MSSGPSRSFAERMVLAHCPQRARPFSTTVFMISSRAKLKNGSLDFAWWTTFRTNGSMNDTLSRLKDGRGKLNSPAAGKTMLQNQNQMAKMPIQKKEQNSD